MTALRFTVTDLGRAAAMAGIGGFEITEHAGGFVVADLCGATLAFEPAGRTRMSARQSVRRDDEVLVEGDIRLACLTRDGWRPSRIPPALAALLEADR